jgi:photosystem II stability/assembly factor-like uncharacterized protein
MVAVLGAAVLLRGETGAPVAWARLGTSDVHSLAFAPGSSDHLYFGHHGGILETVDGGRTWSPLPVTDDAMGMRPSSDGSIVIAGHDVLVASTDGGKTWQPINSDLPSIDIHGFARDPADPLRMWAYLAQGGVYETRDRGRHWEKVTDEHRPLISAVLAPGDTALVGIDPFKGFVRSEDGGRTWRVVSRPEAFPAFSLTTSPDGRQVFIGTGDALLRSDDGGATWQELPFPGDPFALALADDGSTLAAVNRDTAFYRSADSGATWPAP